MHDTRHEAKTELTGNRTSCPIRPICQGFPSTVPSARLSKVQTSVQTLQILSVSVSSALKMLCEVCLCRLEGIDDPKMTARLARLSPPEIQTVATAQDDVQCYTFGHHLTKDSLKRSSDAGCLLCSLTWVVWLQAHRSIHSPTDDGSSYFSTFRLALVGDIVQVRTFCEGTSHIHTLVPVGVTQYDEGITFDVDDSTSGPGARSCAQRWVQNCVEHHTECAMHHEPAFLPTRLLKLDGTCEPPTWQLLLGTDCPLGSRYTTLSYIWGDRPLSQRTRLLHQTMNSFIEGGSIETLSRTFQDAMRASLYFGVHYIWIDSLCIIQDSTDDWSEQAQMMDRVYRNAFLNISAVSGSDDNCGLYHDRDVKEVQPTIVRLPLTGDGEGTRRAFRHKLQRGVVSSWWKDSRSTKRAWCVQERLLSPRVLHFGATQLYWECQQQTATEINPISAFMETSSDSIHRKRLWKRPLGVLESTPPSDTYARIFFDWYVALELYSGANLTYESDKLYALAGLANDMKHVLCELRPDIPHNYIAGIWEEDLRAGICWTSNKHTASTRQADYRAPTWSWASINGKTNHLYAVSGETLSWLVGESECVVSARTYAADEMGALTSAHLELISPMVRLYLKGVQKTTEEAQVLHASHPVTMVRYELPCLPMILYRETPLEHVLQFDVEHEQRPKVFCALMEISKHQSTVADPEYWNIYGILVVEDKSGDTWQRVGWTKLKFATEELALQFVGEFEKTKITVV